MSARTAAAPKSPQKVQRELEDLQLVLKARNGARSRSIADPPLPRFRPAEGELVLPRRRRRRRPGAGGPHRPLQGGARLPLRQGDVVPLVRRALRHAPDHHGDQDRDPLQARAAQHVRLVQPHAGRPGRRRRCTLGDALPAPRSTTRRCASSRPRSCRASRLPGPTLSPLEAGCCASTSRASRTRRSAIDRLRPEDDRQRAPAREAQDPRAPGVARRAGLKAPASPGLPRPTLCTSAPRRGRRTRGPRRPHVATFN